MGWLDWFALIVALWVVVGALVAGAWTFGNWRTQQAYEHGRRHIADDEPLRGWGRR